LFTPKFIRPFEGALIQFLAARRCSLRGAPASRRWPLVAAIEQEALGLRWKTEVL
jgi:hypothetical protein